MLHTEIDNLIAQAIKEQNHDVLRLYRLIKTEFMKVEKADPPVELTEELEVKILLKMATAREESIKQFIAAGRDDLANAEKAELTYLEQLIPAQPTEEEIIEYTREVINTYKMVQSAIDFKLSMRDMKPIMNLVQEKYSSVNGTLISKVLKEFIN